MHIFKFKKRVSNRENHFFNSNCRKKNRINGMHGRIKIKTKKSREFVTFT